MSLLSGSHNNVSCGKRGSSGHLGTVAGTDVIDTIHIEFLQCLNLMLNAMTGHGKMVGLMEETQSGEFMM